MKRDFYELYLEKIRQYGGLKNYARYKAKGPVGMMVRRITNQFPRGSKILEIGAGTGVMSALLAEQGFIATAIDLDKRMVALAKECAGELGAAVNCMEMNMFDIADFFEKGEFRCVVSHGVMEHYDDSQIISSLDEQLTVGETSVFCVPSAAMSSDYKSHGDGTERYLKPKEWLHILGQGGFQCQRIFGAGFGKYCKHHFLPNWLSQNNIAGRVLAGSAAFMEFWTHKS